MSLKLSRLRWSSVAPGAVVAAIVLATLVVVVQRRNPDVVASDIGVTAYDSGVTVVHVPYRRDGGAGTVTILVDGRTIAHVMPAFAAKYGNDNYFFRITGQLPESVLVRITFASDSVVQRLSEQVKVVRVAGPATVATDESAPNIAADAVIALAKAHHADENLPAYASTVVDELKREMRWNATDGVTPVQYVNGMNVWSRQKSLPIRTDRIISTAAAMLDASSRALDAGGAVQAQLLFTRSGRVVGSRTVGIRRIIRDGEDAYIAIHDSVGPIGTDVYRIRNGTVLEYGFSQDTAVLGWVFVQYWNN